MKCPSCAAETSVTETRELPYGIRRRRRCKRAECGRRITTVEVTTPDRRDNTKARVIVIDGVRAKALQHAARDLDELLGNAEIVGGPW